MKTVKTAALIVIVSIVMALLPGCGCDETEVQEPAPAPAVEPAPVVEPPPPVTEPEPTSEPPPAPVSGPTPTIEPTTPVIEPGPAPVSENVSEDRAFIWKISSDNSTAYLLGSIHVASFAMYPLDKSIEEAYRLSDNLAVEVDISDTDQMESAQLLMEHGMYPEGKSLRENLDEGLYDRLAEALGEWGIDIAMLDMFRPWVVYMTLDNLIMEDLGYSAAYGIDLYFLEKASDENKNIVELESASFQLELLSSFSDDLMIMLIEESLDDPMTQEDADEMFEIWEAGDAAGMEAIAFAGIEEEPLLEPFYEEMFDERNLNMAQKIEGFLADEETYFIVVGAGHLVGENGLVNLLEERGYVTEQLYDSD